MQKNDYGAGAVLDRLAVGNLGRLAEGSLDRLVVGSLAVGILAILLRMWLARRGHHPRPAIGARAGCAPHLAGLAGGFAGFWFVVSWPRFFVAPAGFFAAMVFGVLLRRGAQKVFRALLLAALAIFWLGLIPYSEELQRWSAKVMGAIRIDAFVTGAMAALWAFLGVWLWREPDGQQVEEEVGKPVDPEATISAGIRKR